MTTGSAPPTIPSVETGTSPRKWSESVLASSPTRDTPATFKGREGNPEMTEGQSQETQPANTRDQPSIGATVMQTARQYVPEPVGKAVNYATQTAAAAASYLPDSQGIKNTVSSYLSSGDGGEDPPVSLPSTELKGAQPSEHTGGVGALPGNLSESSVALLPDERQERAQECRPTSPRQRRDTIKPSTAGGDDEPRESEKEEAESFDTALSKDEGLVASKPSDASPKCMEVAAESVEGNTAASSSPEESQKVASETKSEQGNAAAVPAIGVVGTAPDTEKLVEKKEDERSDLTSEGPRQGEGPSQDVPEERNKEGGTTGTRKIEGGYGGDYHPALLHPPPPGASVAEYQSSFSSQQEVKDSPTTESGKRASVGAEKKPGFMTMVKGEMKILAGKMSGDEHKVEEGKRIVHGDT